MDDCINQLHRIVWVEEAHGEITYYCKPCDKSYTQYQDCNAGR